MLKGIEKYNYYDQEFFSTGIMNEYEFTIDGKEYFLSFDEKDKYYLYIEGHISIFGPFDDIYKALDGIIFNNMTLRQIIIETDFTFDWIYG